MAFGGFVPNRQYILPYRHRCVVINPSRIASRRCLTVGNLPQSREGWVLTNANRSHSMSEGKGISSTAPASIGDRPLGHCCQPRTDRSRIPKPFHAHAAQSGVRRQPPSTRGIRENGMSIALLGLLPSLRISTQCFYRKNPPSAVYSGISTIWSGANLARPKASIHWLARRSSGWPSRRRCFASGSYPVGNTGSRSGSYHIVGTDSCLTSARKARHPWASGVEQRLV